MNYIMVITWFPLALILWDKHLRGRKRCCRCASFGASKFLDGFGASFWRVFGPYLFIVGVHDVAKKQGGEVKSRRNSSIRYSRMNSMVVVGSGEKQQRNRQSTIHHADSVPIVSHMDESSNSNSNSNSNGHSNSNSNGNSLRPPGSSSSRVSHHALESARTEEDDDVNEKNGNEKKEEEEGEKEGEDDEEYGELRKVSMVPAAAASGAVVGAAAASSSNGDHEDHRGHGGEGKDEEKGFGLGEVKDEGNANNSMHESEFDMESQEEDDSSFDPSADIYSPVSELRYSEKVFFYCLMPCVVKARYCLILFFLALLATSIAFVTQLEPSQTVPALFAPNTNLGRFLTWQQSGFYEPGAYSLRQVDVAFGCDNVLGSTKVADVCGVCDGDCTTCAACDGSTGHTCETIPIADVCGVCGGSTTSASLCPNGPLTPLPTLVPGAPPSPQTLSPTTQAPTLQPTRLTSLPTVSPTPAPVPGMLATPAPVTSAPVTWAPVTLSPVVQGGERRRVLHVRVDATG